MYRRHGRILEARVQSAPGLPRETGIPIAPKEELSTAAKAGIGIGAIVGTIVIATAFILLCLKRRRNSSEAASERTNIPEMEDQDRNLAKRKWFISGRWRSEAQAEFTPQELDSKGVHVVEGPSAKLEASNPGVRDDLHQSHTV